VVVECLEGGVREFSGIKTAVADFYVRSSNFSVASQGKDGGDESRYRCDIVMITLQCGT
jgi:hypothetical protein